VGVWSPGASPALFEPEKHASQGRMLREKLGLLDKFVVLYHGDIPSNRGLIETVNAFQLLTHRHPNIVLFLLGKGSAVPYLKRLVQENKIQNVIVHDAVDYLDVPTYIAMCDVGIVPLPNIALWRYQCPLKLLEYIAMEKVVVLTDIPAHREIVGNREFGVYISSIDPAEIVNGVTYAYENRKKLKEWGVSGRNIVAENYSWEKAAEDLGSFLLSLEDKSRER
jgi:glycosyltransferase involved in cell wall biosynthesis